MLKCSMVVLISLGTIATTLLTPQLPSSAQKRGKTCIDTQPMTKRVGLTLKADKKVTRNDRIIFEPIPIGKASVKPGDVIKYTVIAKNNSRCPLRNLVLKQPIPRGTTYVKDSATSVEKAELLFSIDGGKTFSAKPIVGTQEVPASEYNYLRWRFIGKMRTNSQVQTSYKLQVK